MEDGAVAAVAEGAERLGFRRAWIGEHRQRLVGMAGEDDLVEGPGPA